MDYSLERADKRLEVLVQEGWWRAMLRPLARTAALERARLALAQEPWCSWTGHLTHWTANVLSAKQEH